MFVIADIDEARFLLGDGDYRVVLNIIKHNLESDAIPTGNCMMAPFALAIFGKIATRKLWQEVVFGVNIADERPYDDIYIPTKFRYLKEVKGSLKTVSFKISTELGIVDLNEAFNATLRCLIGEIYRKIGNERPAYLNLYKVEAKSIETEDFVGIETTLTYSTTEE